LCHSTSKNKDKQQARAALIREAHQHSIDMARTYLDRVTQGYARLKDAHEIPEPLLLELNTFSQHAQRQIDQIKRRVIDGETIPHNEKV
jgi:lysophospholipase L1-like esterase